MRLVTSVDGIGASEVEDGRPGLALQLNQRILGLTEERKAGRPQERSECPGDGRHFA